MTRFADKFVILSIEMYVIDDLGRSPNFEKEYLGTKDMEYDPELDAYMVDNVDMIRDIVIDWKSENETRQQMNKEEIDIPWYQRTAYCIEESFEIRD